MTERACLLQRVFRRAALKPCLMLLHKNQLAIANRRFDELQRRIDGLHTDLADARTAAMITGCEAAALRSRLELMTERRPWWRRWFR
jgi:hypothetical protein